jgi:hypothetical protein
MKYSTSFPRNKKSHKDLRRRAAIRFGLQLLLVAICAIGLLSFVVSVKSSERYLGRGGLARYFLDLSLGHPLIHTVLFAGCFVLYALFLLRSWQTGTIDIYPFVWRFSREAKPKTFLIVFAANLLIFLVTGCIALSHWFYSNLYLVIFI